MGRADVYLQPDAGDPVLEPATVLRLARAHAGRAQAVTGVDESGGEARAYLVDEQLVVKTQRPHRLRPRTSLAKEARLLSYLADGPLAGQIPALFGYGRTQTDQGSVEYLVMSRMPGRAVRHASVTGPARTVLLHTLGRLLRALHAQPAGPLAGTSACSRPMTVPGRCGSGWNSAWLTWSTRSPAARGAGSSRSARKKQRPARSARFPRCSPRRCRCIRTQVLPTRSSTRAVR